MAQHQYAPPSVRVSTTAADGDNSMVTVPSVNAAVAERRDTHTRVGDRAAPAARCVQLNAWLCEAAALRTMSTVFPDLTLDADADFRNPDSATPSR
jgi:hypothetical protein